jgi:small subunit ribosomal protein S6
MAQDKKNTYEGMFLFPQVATANLNAAVEHLEELLQRADADVLAFAKWDERRLAYEIKGNKRGVYMLVYFRALPTALAGLERDCNLSEQLLRAMIIRADPIPVEAIQAADGRQQLADEIRLRGERETAGDDQRDPNRSAPDAESRPAPAPAEPTVTAAASPRSGEEST